MSAFGPFRACKAALLLSALAVSLQSVGPVAAQSLQANDTPGTIPIADHVREASQRFGIPEHWIYAVMRAESAGRIKARSHAGAMGLMQIMPATWSILRARYRLGSDPYDPRDNIHAGTAYLREMVDQFGVPGFLAAYNAGPGRYRQYVRNGRQLPRETRAYVAKIMPEIGGGSSHLPALKGQATRSESAPPVRVHWTRSGLFVDRSESNPGDDISIETQPELLAPASIPVSQNAPSKGLFAPISSSGPE